MLPVSHMPAIAFALLLLVAEPRVLPLPVELGFLEGCWSGETKNAHTEERYGNLDGGTLLGTIKTVSGDTLKFFEFLRIFRDVDGIWLQPYPDGRTNAPRFGLVELEPDKAAFENPAHDFPRRIAYRLLPDGRLLTRVAGIVDGKDIVDEYVSLPHACRN